jgi:hypothetical protein
MGCKKCELLITEVRELDILINQIIKISRINFKDILLPISHFVIEFEFDCLTIGLFVY